MWRCHCGETNLNSQNRCSSCQAARVTHEAMSESTCRPARSKNVRFNFFGMGGEANTVDEVERSSEAPRSFNDLELADHYQREKWRNRLVWLGVVVMALALIALLAWQILRPGR